MSVNRKDIHNIKKKEINTTSFIFWQKKTMFKLHRLIFRKTILYLKEDVSP